MGFPSTVHISNFANLSQKGKSNTCNIITGPVKAVSSTVSDKPQFSSPQCYSPQHLGTEMTDPVLMMRNKQIEEGLLRAADEYYIKKDLRWFFAFAHGQITRQINQSIGLYQRPNAVLRLNIHFAEEFLRAIHGQPHQQWKQVFKKCAALQNTSEETSWLIGEVEFCGAAMANVHIHVDLAAALQQVGCITPTDYGNTLIFVNKGSLAALVRLRGSFFAPAESILNQLFGILTEIEVKTWRNAVYNQVCNANVPEPEKVFYNSVNK